MAKRGFLITFVRPGGRPPDTHRIRNWAEDLLVEAEKQGWGTVVNSDTACDRVWVVASSDRALGDLAQGIRRTLRHHKLVDDATITKVTGTAELDPASFEQSARDEVRPKRDDA